MNYLLIGAAGFIGTNLILKLSENSDNKITSVDRKKDFFNSAVFNKTKIIESELTSATDFYKLTRNQDIVFHLVSFSRSVSESIDSEKERQESVLFTSHLLDACWKNKVKKVVFVSSGGTVYGNTDVLPIPEACDLNPISAYGCEKVSDEECFKKYSGEYHIFRLSNPYGPYQRIEGAIGVVTKFLNKILNNELITIVGDGSIVRDFIYIDDVINAMVNVIISDSESRILNIGSGIGTTINQVISTIEDVTGIEANVEYKESRSGDVSKNYLDVSLYEKEFGKLAKTELRHGIEQIIDFYK